MCVLNWTKSLRLSVYCLSPNKRTEKTWMAAGYRESTISVMEHEQVISATDQMKLMCGLLVCYRYFWF